MAAPHKTYDSWLWVINNYSSRDFFRLQGPDTLSLLNYHIYGRVPNVFPGASLYRGYVIFLHPKTEKEVRMIFDCGTRLYVEPFTSDDNDDIVDLIRAVDSDATIYSFDQEPDDTHHCVCCSGHRDKRPRIK